MKILILLLLSISAQARVPECRQVYAILQESAQYHLDSPVIDEDFLVKSYLPYLEMRDSSQVYLLGSEKTELLKKLEDNKKTYWDQFVKGNCKFFNTEDEAINQGHTRWLELVKQAALDPAILSAKDTPRDENNVQPYNTVMELKAYARSYVGSSLKKLMSDNTSFDKAQKKFLQDIFTNDLKYSKKIKTEFGNYITKALLRSFDPHSDYISHDELTEFSNSLSAVFEGIGIQLVSKDKHIEIASVYNDSPAQKTKQIMAGDEVVEVNNSSVSGLDLQEVSDKIQGKVGSVLVLTLKHNNALKKVKVVRDLIKNQAEQAKGRVLSQNNKNLLVIELPVFYFDSNSQAGATSDIQTLYKRYKTQYAHIDGILLDLRSNAGGSLDEAVRLVGLFRPHAVAVQEFSGLRITRLRATEFSDPITQPLIVLTSRFSASASEIVAGALKDYHRAIVVGDEQTFGKGTVQGVFDKLNQVELGAVKITVSKFYTPSGKSTQMEGVKSDIKLPSPTANVKYGEDHLTYALKWTQISSALENEKLPDNAQVIKKLSLLSQQRTKNLPATLPLTDNTFFPSYISLNEAEPLKLDKDIELKEAVNILQDYINLKP